MKVVLFCGGLGMRLRELSGDLPKPMVRIGQRPILWHVMKYYAHFGHRDFILCLGYKADVIREYFLHPDAAVTADGAPVERVGTGEMYDRDGWTITFVDTGLDANVGMRLRAVRRHLKDEDMFLANYADGLTDLDLAHMIAAFGDSGKVGCCLCTSPPRTFHVVRLGEGNLVRDIRSVEQTNVSINGGYFIFRQAIFDYIEDGEELVVEPFRRLIREEQLLGYPHQGFWCMDTFKEHCELTRMHQGGHAPWEVWKPGPVSSVSVNPVSDVADLANMAAETRSRSS